MTKSTRQKQTELLQLAQLKFQSDQMGMAALARQETALKRHLKDLNQSEKHLCKTTSSDAVLQRANAILPWQNWVAQRRDQMNIELAQVMAQKEFARAAMRQSFGQVEAAKSLLAQALRTEQQTVKRQTYHRS
ncbi:hypothetical protein NBRC116601_22100 [Cognatishimia sp. WU-CL00825]|uniref:hypothetical protein n=1 Tax=Cognatishimia sp. WU-CL00825 TaxID=3127658 RepID=UPI003105053E